MSDDRHRANDSLGGKSILLIEDDWLVAVDTARAFEHVGAQVVGLCPSEEAALASLNSAKQIDFAIVDIRLTDGIRFGVATKLQQQRTPFLFLTASNRALIPPRFSQIRVFTKPVDFGLLILAAASFFPRKPLLS